MTVAAKMLHVAQVWPSLVQGLTQLRLALGQWRASQVPCRIKEQIKREEDERGGVGAKGVLQAGEVRQSIGTECNEFAVNDGIRQLSRANGDYR
jgi:hypothetical protein